MENELTNNLTLKQKVRNLAILASNTVVATPTIVKEEIASRRFQRDQKRVAINKQRDEEKMHALRVKKMMEDHNQD